MNITCAIVYNDTETVGKLEDFITQTPILTLCGKFKHPAEVLSVYYKHHIQLFFVEIGNNELGSYHFCQLLPPPTRIIFISKDKKAAADCFRLDALDYLLTDITYPVFLEAINKAIRWFNPRLLKASSNSPQTSEDASYIYIKSSHRVMRLKLEDISYIQSLGDYVKIYCSDDTKPILSLCSMKDMESILPPKDFIRVHRSYIVCKKKINILERDNIFIGKASIPVGASYKKQFQDFLKLLTIL